MKNMFEAHAESVKNELKKRSDVFSVTRAGNKLTVFVPKTGDSQKFLDVVLALSRPKDIHTISSSMHNVVGKPKHSQLTFSFHEKPAGPTFGLDEVTRLKVLARNPDRINMSPQIRKGWAAGVARLAVAERAPAKKKRF